MVVQQSQGQKAKSERQGKTRQDKKTVGYGTMTVPGAIPRRPGARRCGSHCLRLGIKAHTSAPKRGLSLGGQIKSLVWCWVERAG
jgi:hypothetical protein